MKDPVVGPGPLSRSELRAWADAQLQDQAQAMADAPTPAEKRAAAHARYNEKSAALMRKRRKDPRIRAREKLSIKARDTAYRRLAAAFPDDFLRIVNDERILHGLPILVPRRKRTMTVTTATTAEDEQDAPQPESRFVERNGVDPTTCRHDQGIKKFSYGKFCALCGSMIK